MSVDIVVARQIDGEEHILLIQRKHAPFEGCWALPGGFLDIDETLEHAAVRELQEETGLDATSVEQIGTFSAVGRDPRWRVITTAFSASVSPNQTAVAADDAAACQWLPVHRSIKLAFDHAEIIQQWKKKKVESA